MRINGETLDTGKTEKVYLTRSAGTAPAVSGYVKSELVIKYHGELSAEPGSPVETSFGTAVFAVHFIDSIKRNGNGITIKAHDLMRGTDRMYTGEIPAQIHTPSFISALARECGFTGAENVPLMPLFAADVKDRTIKHILKIVSDYACGVWYCTNSGALRFTGYTESSCSVSPYEHSRIYIHSLTGPFTGVIAENTASRKIYTAGTVGNERTAVSVSGNAFTSERTRELASALAGRSVRAFYCAHAKISEATEGITAYYMDGVSYPAYISVIHFGTDMYADIRTEDVSGAYNSLYDRARGADDALTEGRLYSTALTDSDGICITEDSDEEDIRLRRKYTFSAVRDGVTDFDGAVIDGVMPTMTEHISATRERIVYGDTSYILSYDIQGGRKTNIRLTKEVR